MAVGRAVFRFLLDDRIRGVMSKRGGEGSLLEGAWSGAGAYRDDCCQAAR